MEQLFNIDLKKISHRSKKELDERKKKSKSIFRRWSSK